METKVTYTEKDFRNFLIQFGALTMLCLLEYYQETEEYEICDLICKVLGDFNIQKGERKHITATMVQNAIYGHKIKYSTDCLANEGMIVICKFYAEKIIDGKIKPNGRF